MRKKLRDLSLSKPLILSICLMCIAMIFRLLDIFAFRLDDLLGEIILSKVIGFIIVILFVKMIGGNISDIGFNVNSKWYKWFHYGIGDKFHSYGIYWYRSWRDVLLY